MVYKLCIALVSDSLFSPSNSLILCPQNLPILMYYVMVKLSALCVFEKVVCMGAVSACVCAPHACSAHRGQRRESDSLNLELQMVVTNHIRVLEIEHRSFGNIQCS